MQEQRKRFQNLCLQYYLLCTLAAKANRIAFVKNICQEFASEKKIEINIRGMFIREVQVP